MFETLASVTSYKLQIRNKRAVRYVELCSCVLSPV